MSEKKIINLDLTGCKYLGEIHERIREAFNGMDEIGTLSGICYGANAMLIKLRY